MVWQILLLILVPIFSNAKTHYVGQKNEMFDRKEIEIELGDTIIFRNDESDVTHNVYSHTPGNEFEIRVQKPGTKTPREFSSKEHKIGKLTVRCVVHPKMKLKVKVRPPGKKKK